MANFDLKTVRAMQDAGLVASVEFGGGFCSTTKVELTPEQVVSYLEKGLDYVLRLQGIDTAEYEEWQATDGRAMCMETLKSGKFRDESLVSAR